MRARQNDGGLRQSISRKYVCRNFFRLRGKSEKAIIPVVSGRRSGSYNVIIFILFDDGVEWAVKIPRGNFKEGQENIFLMSEYATLYFLQREMPTVPAPKVHGSCFTSNNPTKTPYFIMDKSPRYTNVVSLR